MPWRWVRAAAPGPLLIDPTIYNDYANDTRLQSATNVGSETTLMVGKKSGQVKKRTIIKFDLQYSSIPSNATVLNAQMQLHYFYASNAGGSAWVDRWVQAHQLLNDWHELQADSLKRLTGVNWLAPRAKIGPGSNPANEDANGQFESTLLFQTGQTGTWKAWDLTALTQKWVNGTAANYGVILWATNEDVNAYDLRFYSSEHENKQPQLMIIWSDQPKTVYFLKDHLGSIRATVLDSAGAPVVAYDDYDPWGYILSGRTMASSVLPAATRNKFTGKEWDDEFGVNWLHFPYRSYDPEIARWMVRDPWAMKYPSWSPYVYALDQPNILVDPYGLFPDGPGYYRASPNTRTLGFIVRHPAIAASIGSVVNKGLNMSTVAARFARNTNLPENLAREGSHTNAFRHTFWQASITERFGANIAAQVGNAHESNPFAPILQRSFGSLSEADQTIDLLNNIIGRQIGADNPGASPQELAVKVLDEFKNNGLWVATIQDDGSVTISRAQLSDEEYSKALEVLQTTNQYGFTSEQWKELLREMGIERGN